MYVSCESTLRFHEYYCLRVRQNLFTDKIHLCENNMAKSQRWYMGTLTTLVIVMLPLVSGTWHWVNVVPVQATIIFLDF